MSKSPFNDTFDEYLSFHKNVIKNAEQTSNKLIEAENKASIDNDEFMESHNLLTLDKFLKSMNEKYGI